MYTMYAKALTNIPSYTHFSLYVVLRVHPGKKPNHCNVLEEEESKNCSQGCSFLWSIMVTTSFNVREMGCSQKDWEISSNFFQF